MELLNILFTFVSTSLLSFALLLCCLFLLLRGNPLKCLCFYVIDVVMHYFFHYCLYQVSPEKGAFSLNGIDRVKQRLNSIQIELNSILRYRISAFHEPFIVG